jgi:hypothetical protein
VARQQGTTNAPQQSSTPPRTRIAPQQLQRSTPPSTTSRQPSATSGGS